MTIHPIDTTQAASGSSGSGSSGSSSSGSDMMDGMNENAFLQLLVAQIQYQDPTNPTDSTTFVTQLAQFSSLEQLVAIRSDLDTEVQQSTTSTQNPNSQQGGH